VKPTAAAAGIEGAACLALSAPLAGCSRCADICPTGAIDPVSLAIAPELCLGCGRCVAVCPTEAIAVQDAIPSPAADIECVRVGARDRADGASQAACLGALSEAALLEAVAALEGDVRLIDRGWCASCPAGGDPAPWAAAVEAANSTLAPLSQHRVRVVTRPTPERRAASLPERLEDRGAARRGLFRRLTAAAPPATPRRARGPIAPRAAQRRHAAIERLARQAEAEVPAALFPVMAISDACRNSRICAAACPTGALSLGSEAGGIDFAAGACIACGACESACPEGALTLSPQGTGSLPDRPVALRRVDTAICRTCGSRFAPEAGEDSCLPCARSAELAREAFALMRRPRREASGA
jgi:ferredoxin